jgi:hypothetical protein
LRPSKCDAWVIAPNIDAERLDFCVGREKTVQLYRARRKGEYMMDRDEDEAGFDTPLAMATCGAPGMAQFIEIYQQYAPFLERCGWPTGTKACEVITTATANLAE